ncbi:unnamed protein product [Linum trigynum]
MFSKIHSHHHQQQHPFPPQHHHFHLEETSDEPTPPPAQPPSKAEPTSAGDGATIEVVRRPRGRPPGSKNRPKPPVIITREPSDPPMSPYILEIPGGGDVVDAVARFCRRKNIGLCVLTGSGTVANVTLRQPSTTPGATVTFHGRFDILSVSATFFPYHGAAQPPVPNSFSISLAGPQGQIVGGIVAGGLVAAGTVFIIGATFSSPSFHRLPGVDEQEGRSSGSAGGGGGGGGEATASPAVSGAGGAQGDSSGDGVLQPAYSEAMWPPNCRPPSLSRTPVAAAPPGGGNEIVWGDITPPSPSSSRGRHAGSEMMWPPPPNSRAGRSPPRSEMMWPPNGRAPSSRSPPPPPATF